MKKIIFTLIITLALTLAACSGTRNNTQQFNGGSSTSGANAELPIATKLAAGSFKLEKTNDAITKEEAAQLLPLWQVYAQLISSDTAAQEEVAALTDQIQATMTPDQMKTINGFNMTQQDIFAVMQEQGIQFAAGRQNGQGTGTGNQQFGNGNGTGNTNRNQGGGDGGQFFFGGGGPGGGSGGGGFGGGQGLNPQQIATAQARRQQNGGGNNSANRLTTPLVDALIKLLEQKAGP